MKTDISKLSYENSALYIKMTSYLTEKRLSRTDYNRVCEDIFVMLSDAQERGESAESIFPEGYKKFLDEVASNCCKEKWYISLINVVFWALCILAAVILVDTLFTHLWPDEGEYISGVTACLELSGFIGAIIAAIVGASVSIFHHIFAFNKKRYYYIAVIATVAVAIAVATITDLIITSTLITFNWVAFACACTGAAVLVRLAGLGISKFTANK